MTDPEPYPDDFDLNADLKRVEDAAVDLVVYARNAQNAESGEDTEQWVSAIDDSLGSLETRVETVHGELNTDE